jgi:hypothetical protein
MNLVNDDEIVIAIVKETTVFCQLEARAHD